MSTRRTRRDRQGRSRQANNDDVIPTTAMAEETIDPTAVLAEQSSTTSNNVAEHNLRDVDIQRVVKSMQALQQEVRVRDSHSTPALNNNNRFWNT